MKPNVSRACYLILNEGSDDRLKPLTEFWPALVDKIESAISSLQGQPPLPETLQSGPSYYWKNPHALCRRPECQQLAIYDPGLLGLKQLLAE